MPISEKYRIEPSFEKIKEIIKAIFPNKSRIALTIIATIAGVYAANELIFKRAKEKQKKPGEKAPNYVPTDNDLLEGEIGIRFEDVPKQGNDLS